MMPAARTASGSTRRTFVSLLLAATAGLLLLPMAAPAWALVAGGTTALPTDAPLSCDRSWTGGDPLDASDWWDPLNWSPPEIPAATDNVCIIGGPSPVHLFDLGGVSQTASVAGLTLGDPSGTGAPMGILMTAGCSHRVSLTLGDGGTIAANATVQLEAARACSGSSTQLSAAGGVLTVAGSISLDAPGQGDVNIHDYLEGDITNAGGIINAVNPLEYDGGTLDNAGTLTGRAVYVNSGQLTDDAGGTISSSGVYVQNGSTFDQGQGSSGSTPIQVGNGTLVYTGSGASTIHAFGSVAMTGDVSAGQTLDIESSSDCQGAQDAVVTAPSTFSNAGTIRLTNVSTSCNPGSSTMALTSGTLLNTGLITAELGGGGGRALSATLNDTGTLNVQNGVRLTLDKLTNYNPQTNALLGGTFTISGILALPLIDIHTLGAALTLSGAGTVENSDTSANALAGLSAITSNGSLSLVSDANLTTTGALSNSHHLTLGPTDTLTVPGGYGQTAAAALVVQVSSSGMGTIDGTGAPAALAGRLTISPVGGFVPALGTAFTLIGYPSESGHFSSILGAPAGGGSFYVIEYDAAGAFLVVRATSLAIDPSAGQPGTTFTVTGDGYSPGETVPIKFGSVPLVAAAADGSGHFQVAETVPDVTVKQYKVAGRGTTSLVSASRTFTVRQAIQNSDFRLIGQEVLNTDPAAEYSTTTNSDEAMDVNDTSHLVATYQEGQYPDQGALEAGFATSFDDGHTWTSGDLPGLTTAVGGSYPRAGNPRVAVGLNGAAYIVSQVLDPAACRSGIALSASADQGLTWADPTFVVQDTTCGGQDDMTGISVDTYKGSPFYGRIYVVWDRLQGSAQPVLISSSSDGGVTWSSPVQVTPAGIGGTDPTPLVQPGGRVTVYYPQPGAALETVQTSSDGGATFGSPVIVHDDQGADPPGILAGNAQGIGDAAVDPVTGALFVVWPDRRYDVWGLDGIVMSRSTDGGQTWQGPLLLSGSTSSPVDRFTPSINAYGGYVAATWYHWSQDTSGVRLNRGFTFSSNGGQAWSKSLLIGCGSKPLEIDLDYSALVDGLHFFGNYEGVVTTPTEAHPVWTVANQGGTGSYYQVTWSGKLTYGPAGGGPATDPVC